MQLLLCIVCVCVCVCVYLYLCVCVYICIFAYSCIVTIAMYIIMYQILVILFGLVWNKRTNNNSYVCDWFSIACSNLIRFNYSGSLEIRHALSSSIAILHALLYNSFGGSYNVIMNDINFSYIFSSKAEQLISGGLFHTNNLQHAGRYSYTKGHRINMNTKDLKNNTVDEIIDHCAGLLLIKPICTAEVQQHLEDHGTRFDGFNNIHCIVTLNIYN